MDGLYPVMLLKTKCYFLAEHGYRVIAFDRRGHGRSSQPWAGHTIDQYVKDLHQLIEHLNLDNFALVGHSTGGAVVTRYTAKIWTAEGH